jgi:pantetheine-phosphate adenylyltransferase
MRTAVYAGSFDPVTNGHLFMIREGARLFDRLVVAIGENPEKRSTFPLEQRLDLLTIVTRGLKNVRVDHFSHRFLIEYAAGAGAQYILRGIRNSADYAFESTMRNVNGDLNARITTVFLMPPRELAEVSSSFIRGLVGPRGWQRVVKKYVPGPVFRALLKLER